MCFYVEGGNKRVAIMRYNEKELAEIARGDAVLEGRLNYRAPSGSFSQTGFKERWFKLKANLLFYFRIDQLGNLEKQPAGVFILENSHVQYEVCTGVPFAFSLIFREDPDKKHIFSGQSESHVNKWVAAMKQATYEYMRAQLILLQTKINFKTGKDPLLLYPHNRGTVRSLDASPTFQKSKLVGPRSSSFKCHLGSDTARSSNFKGYLTGDASNNVRQKEYTETANLIDL